jgi:hypothetical protein
MLDELKLLLKDFLGFLKKDFKIAPYLYTFIIIAISIAFVYATGTTGKLVAKSLFPFENKYINSILRYGILYYTVCIPVLLMQGQKKLITPKFILKSAFLIAVLAGISAFSWTSLLSFSNYEYSEKTYLARILWRLKYLLFFLPIIILMRIFLDKEISGLYGLCRGKSHIKAYLYLYIIIVPILIAVSFTQSFLSYYPLGKIWKFNGLFGSPAMFNYIIFEIVYIASFIMVELIFRGVFVIGMKKHISSFCVLPMIAIYVAFHFGKPPIETISSAFGGYFLGAIAYQSKHIWGGIFIHAGIAFTIEFTRLLQYLMLGI